MILYLESLSWYQNMALGAFLFGIGIIAACWVDLMFDRWMERKLREGENGD